MRNTNKNINSIETIKTPRVVISAIKSGSGKTMITCGLIRALINAGYNVAARKCGPDYIDPMFHRRALKVKSGNLDSFFTDEELLKYLLVNDADITIIEGVMGYYDGLGGVSVDASTYDVARITSSPVILIVDAKGASVTLSAMIKGVLEYKTDNNISGIILNRVSKAFYERIRLVLEDETGISVIGYLPELKEANIESRYLGLMQPEEIKDIDSRLNTIADTLSETVDFDRLIRIANRADAIASAMPASIEELTESDRASFTREAKPVIAVASDEAFSFYYDENIELLRMLGADIRLFSPLHDASIPIDANGLIFYGGYPEIYAEELAANVSMKESVKAAYRAGMPVIAECGGFMYMQETLSNVRKQEYSMCGLLPSKSYYSGRLVRFGYIQAMASYGGLYGDRSDSFRGHEFHHFDSSNNGEGFRISKPLSEVSYDAIVYDKNSAMGYPHIYAYSNPKLYLSYIYEAARYKYIDYYTRRWDTIAKPLNSLGVLENHVVRLYSLLRMSGNVSKVELRPALVQFCADHGVVCEGVTQTDSAVTRIVADNFTEGKSSVNYMADVAECDVYTVDIGMDCEEYPNADIKQYVMINRKIRRKTANLRKEAAMTSEECLKAIETGKEMVRELKAKGYNAIALGEMGIGNTTPTAVLAAVMLGLDARTVCGRGAGLSDEGLVNKINVIDECISRIKQKELIDPVLILAEGGGLEIAGMTGVILGGLEYNIPVILDGCITCIAALMATAIDRRCEYVLLPSHESAEISGQLALRSLSLDAPIKAGLCLGEGTGAMMYIPMLKMTLSVYNNMGSFENIKVKAYEKFC